VNRHGTAMNVDGPAPSPTPILYKGLLFMSAGALLANGHPDAHRPGRLASRRPCYDLLHGGRDLHLRHALFNGSSPRTSPSHGALVAHKPSGTSSGRWPRWAPSLGGPSSSIIRIMGRQANPPGDATQEPARQMYAGMLWARGCAVHRTYPQFIYGLCPTGWRVEPLRAIQGLQALCSWDSRLGFYLLRRIMTAHARSTWTSTSVRLAGKGAPFW
jgi:hypothetical protein